MQKRPLGRSGLSIAPLVFGGNVFGWTADRETSFRLLDAFVDRGFNAVDTAEAYSSWVPGHKGGESETIIGDWLESSGKRDKVVIATKVGWRQGDEGGLLSRANILKACDASLKRLKTDVIDLYQSHSDDPETPFEETLGAYAELIAAGKVRAIGCSNISGARLRESLGVAARESLPRYESVQPPYNLVQRDPFESELKPIVEREGLGVISYFGLARGFLSGKYRSESDLSKSVRGGGVAQFMTDRNMAVLRRIDAVSDRLGANPARVSLAWIMARPGLTAPIASATSLEQLEDLMAAADLQLDAEALADLDAVSR